MSSINAKYQGKSIYFYKFYTLSFVTFAANKTYMKNYLIDIFIKCSFTIQK